MSPRKNCVVSPAELRPRHQSHCPHCRLRDASSWGHKVSITSPSQLPTSCWAPARWPAHRAWSCRQCARWSPRRTRPSPARGRTNLGEIVIRSWVVTAGLWWGNDPGGANLSILSSHSRADADTSSYNFTSSWLPRGISDNVGMRAVPHHHHRSLALQI